jgi:hypothetical protein
LQGHILAVPVYRDCDGLPGLIVEESVEIGVIRVDGHVTDLSDDVTSL